MAPVWEALGRDHGGIVSPVLEEGTLLLAQQRKHRGAIGVQARHQDVVVRTPDDIDGVHLHEPEALDLTPNAHRAAAPRGVVEETLRVQKGAGSGSCGNLGDVVFSEHRAGSYRDGWRAMPPGVDKMGRNLGATRYSPPMRFSRRYQLRDSELNRALEDLVERAAEEYGVSEGADEARQIIVSALRLLRDGAPRGDIKLVNNALKELRHSFRVFEPYRQTRKVAVFGSARTQPEQPEWEQARVFAERIVQRGWMVITGAGDGIMGAAQGGAGRASSFGVNIRLPFEQSANATIDGDAKLINFRYFFTRKLTFVKEAHAIALFPGGFGTHDEGFEALTLMQTGKSEILPVVFVDAPGGSYWRDWQEYIQSHLKETALIGEHDLGLFKITDDVDEAASEILNFYSNYHSSRYVDDLLVVRTRIAPTAEQLERINEDFKDIITGGRIEVGDALPREAGEVEHYPRMTLRFNRRDIGRLRGLIDRLNSFVPDEASPATEAIPHEIVARELTPEAEVAEESDEA